MNGQHFQTAVRRPTGDALEEFMLLNGRYSNFTKETFFIRYVSKGSQANLGNRFIFAVSTNSLGKYVSIQ